LRFVVVSVVPPNAEVDEAFAHVVESADALRSSSGRAEQTDGDHGPVWPARLCARTEKQVEYPTPSRARTEVAPTPDDVTVHDETAPVANDFRLRTS
jgi:hypothetical protein